MIMNKIEQYDSQIAKSNIQSIQPQKTHNNLKVEANISKVKDYTFGGFLKNKICVTKSRTMSIEEPFQDEKGNLWKTNLFIDDQNNSEELRRFSLNSIFNISNLFAKKLKISSEKPVKEAKKTNKINQLYQLIVNKLNHDSINHIPTYIDDSINSAVNEMENYYSTKIVEILTNNFKIDEYFTIFR